MRSKLVLAALTFLSTLPIYAQVAPAAKISGLPLGVGGALSDYSVDYGQGRRMIGITAWADYNVFHGLGVQVEGTSIFAARPSTLTKMRQDTIKGGLIYKAHPVFKIRPFVTYMGGLESIDFPDTRNPLYTHDTYSMTAASAGGEYRLWRTLFVRAEYEYQWVPNYHGKHTLDPNGYTIGAMYYLRGPHHHY